MPNIVSEIRKELSLTQTELAAKLGTDQSTISRWETGEVPINDRTELAMRALRAGIESKAA